MKKLFYIILSILVFISCSTNKVKDDVFVKTKANEIINNNIENVDFSGTMDFINNEINFYQIDKINVKEIPILKLDVKFSEAVSDVIVSNEINNSTILVDFNFIDKITTNQNIPFFVSSNDNLNFKLKNNLEVDNTVFEIEKIKSNDMTIYYLKPYFIDEKTFTEKSIKDFDRTIPFSLNKENLIVNFEKIIIKNGITYKSSISKIYEAKKTLTKNNKIYFVENDNKLNIKIDENNELKENISNNFIIFNFERSR